MKSYQIHIPVNETVKKFLILSSWNSSFLRRGRSVNNEYKMGFTKHMEFSILEEIIPVITIITESILTKTQSKEIGIVANLQQMSLAERVGTENKSLHIVTVYTLISIIQLYSQ